VGAKYFSSFTPAVRKDGWLYISECILGALKSPEGLMAHRVNGMLLMLTMSAAVVTTIVMTPTGLAVVVGTAIGTRAVIRRAARSHVHHWPARSWNRAVNDCRWTSQHGRQASGCGHHDTRYKQNRSRE